MERKETMNKKLYEQVEERVNSCILCDSEAASVTYLGKPVCNECLKYVKSTF